MLCVLGQGASRGTPLTPWSQRSSGGARQQAEALTDLRPDLQQRNQDRGEDWPKQDAHDGLAAAAVRKPTVAYYTRYFSHLQIGFLPMELAS